ncbi:MAG: hypothetical protein DMF12_00120 [Verrucomicrobia bacterium]|nr:MAG: hypothetical protein DMF12_00120 [Verrucomicrobiota bacterium]
MFGFRSVWVKGSELTIDTRHLLSTDAAMPRPLRIQYVGARYHAMSRGDRREAIHYDDADRVELLRQANADESSMDCKSVKNGKCQLCFKFGSCR